MRWGFENSVEVEFLENSSVELKTGQCSNIDTCLLYQQSMLSLINFPMKCQINATFAIKMNKDAAYFSAWENNGLI